MITKKQIKEIEQDILRIFNEPLIHRMRRKIADIQEQKNKTPEGRYRQTLRELEKQYSEVTDQAIKRAKEFTKETQDRITDILSTATAYDADNLAQLRSQINIAMEEYEKKLSDNIQVLQSEAWDNGLNLTDVTLTDAGITASLPSPPVAQLAVAKDFSADLITNITSDALSRINSEVTLGVMTGRSVPDVLKNVKGILTKTPPKVTGTGRKYSLGYRSEMIARTEIARIHDIANRARLKQAQEVVPEMQVQYIAEEDACEECIPYRNEIYKSIDEAPDIPVHPNCRCVLIPYLKEFAEYEEEETEDQFYQRVINEFKEANPKEYTEIMRRNLEKRNGFKGKIKIPLSEAKKLNADEWVSMTTKLSQDLEKISEDFSLDKIMKNYDIKAKRMKYLGRKDWNCNIKLRGNDWWINPRVSMHELYHGVDFGLPENIREEWFDLYHDLKFVDFPTKYSTTNVGELFAESMTSYKLNQKLNPKIKKLAEKTLKQDLKKISADKAYDITQKREERAWQRIKKLKLLRKYGL